MKTSAERQRELIRTTTLLQTLAARLGVTGHYQFAGEYDKALPGMRSTQGSNKWERYFNGKKGKRPLKTKLLASLCELFPDAGRLYHDGPSDLWCAMWGDEQDLWRLCRTRYACDGAEYDDHRWQAMNVEFQHQIAFGDALRKFEGTLLSANAYKRHLSLRYLSEAIAFYRLHRFMKNVAPSEVDGAGAYQCVRMCLDNWGVRSALNGLTSGVLDVYKFLACELAEIETGRLARQRSFSNGIPVDDLVGYVARPQALISDAKFTWMKQPLAPCSAALRRPPRRSKAIERNLLKVDPLPAGFVLVDAVLTPYQAYLVRKWAEEAKPRLQAARTTAH